MHKRIVFGIILLLAVLCGLWAYSRTQSDAPHTEALDAQQNGITETVQTGGELRAVWVNYNELSMKLYENGGTESDFRKKAA